MNLYRRFREGLVMNYYNELTKDKNEVLFSPSYSMSGVRAAVRIMVFSLVISVVSLPIGVSIFFIWLFLCSYIYKGSVESQMGNGYPYLEAGDMIGLMIGYLIMIPIALGVYFLFLGGYEYLADLADLSQREGFFARLLVLFVAWISYMFLFRNNTWDDRNKEWIKEFEAQDQEIEKKRKEEDREKNETYQDFIKNLDEKFTPPKDIKSIEKIKDPVISKKKLDNFIQWVHSISKDNKRLDLASLLNKNKKLEVIVPGLSISICKIEKQPWASEIECLDGQDLDTYKIYYNCKYNCWEFSDNRKWVTIINNPNVTDEVCDDIYESEVWWIEADSSDEKLYLEEGDFYLPYNLYSEHYNSYSDYLYQSLLYCTQEVDFWEKSVVINGGKFKFKENEKEYLILVLMASYKPSLLKRILKELEK